MPAEVLWKSGVEQAELVRSGETSARELAEAALAAIDELNEELNCVVTRDDARVLAAADAIEPGDERPLAGVPIVMKDLVAFVEGWRMTFGSNATGDWVAPFDSALTRRLKDAGAVIVAKTSTPELGILPTTEPHRFGPARNPWNTAHTTGGSSGGSAAAVASGMVAIGHANDGGGSIRIPASCCGLVGLKPSRGRISGAPVYGDLVSSFAIEGCVSRTVQDTAVVLDVLHGYETGDPYWCSDPSAPFSEAPGRDPGKLRIAWTATAPNGAPVDPECERAAREAAELLESLGHDVSEAPPFPAGEEFTHAFIKVWTSGVGAGVIGAAALLGGDVDRGRLEPLTREMAEIAESISAADYLLAMDTLRAMSRQVVALWQGFDVLVTPTLALPPVPIGWHDPDEGEPALQMLRKAAAFVPFTPPFNATGQPGISLPLHHSDEGLPIGVQLVGPPEGEELLLSLGGQLEQARPWAERRPELVAS